MRRALLIFLAVALAASLRQQTVEAGPTPVLSSPFYAAIVGGTLTIEGSDLGNGLTPRSVELSFEGTSLNIPAGASNVIEWTNNRLRLQVPLEARSGSLRVVVDSAESAHAELRLYELTTYPSSSSTGSVEFPLDVDVDQAGNVWLIEEASQSLKVLQPPDLIEPAKLKVLQIPQAAGPGIFARTDGNTVLRTPLSGRAEDIDVQPDGSVWFTQGGHGLLGDGLMPNPSRVIQYRPVTNTFACYNVPIDNAHTIGVLVDQQRGRVWYTDDGYAQGFAIMSFDPARAPSDCFWDPYGPTPPSRVCAQGETGACHQRFPVEWWTSPAHLELAPDGAIWFTDYLGTSLSRLDPDQGVVTRFPLPEPIFQEPPSMFPLGSGPWDLEFDSSGDLWLTEFHDGTLMRFRPSLMIDSDCTQLDAEGRNPCAEDVYVHSDGTDKKHIHSLHLNQVGEVLFTARGAIGILLPAQDEAVVLIELPDQLEQLAGIVQDEATGDIWFAQFDEKELAVLRQDVEDGDGIDAAVDNCPQTFNIDQLNTDRDFVDLSAWNWPFNDLTWPVSDHIGDACDDDADNDLLSSAQEAIGCLSASAPTNPTLRDTDGDLVLDGAECALGSDPADAGSKPLVSASADPDRDRLPTLIEAILGTDPLNRDTDGDRLGDGLEYLAYGSNPLVANTDGDVCPDSHEAASVNADKVVSSLDLLIIALSFGNASSLKYVREFDVNRDGAITATDLAMAATSFGVCGSAY